MAAAAPLGNTNGDQSLAAAKAAKLAEMEKCTKACQPSETQPHTKAMWEAALAAIKASENSKFLQAMVDGDLAIDKFRYYVMQDSLYLSDFSACLDALGDHPGISAQDSKQLHGYADGAKSAEQGLHSSFFQQWGPEYVAQAKTTKFSPNSLLYTSYLKRVVHTGTHAEGLASLLPCFWVYNHVGCVMWKRREDLPASASRPNEFDRWIDMYGGEAFTEHVTEMRTMVEEWAEKSTPEIRAKMTEHFVKGCELEWMFWDGAWQLQQWPKL